MNMQSEIMACEPVERYYTLVDKQRTILKIKAMTAEEAAKRNENVKELGYVWVSGGRRF